MSTILKAESLNLEEYLRIGSKNIFKIPYTQRPYEWTKSHVERLFNDIIALYEDEDTNHVLNFITVYTENGYQNIYDGQQRTVTLIIIVINIVNKLRELGKNDTADNLESKFILDEDWRNIENDLIKISFDDDRTNKFFINYLIKGKDSNLFKISDNERKLKDNHNLIKKLLDDYIKEKGLSGDDLINLFEAMMDRMYVILLKTESEEIANQMFETLNNTGKKLSNFYVLKNKCVKVLGEKLTSKYWDDIEMNLDGLNKNNFIFQYVSMFNGKTGNSKVLDVLEKKKLYSKELTEKTLKELRFISNYYLEAEQPNRIINPTNSKDKIKYKDLLKDLKLFKAKQFRPLLFAMLYKEYSLADINVVLEKILSLQIRNFFIGEHKANTVENMYPSVAKKVYESNTSKLDFIIETIIKKRLNNKETEVKLKNRIFNKAGDNKLLRYILRKIYDYENHGETKINSDSSHVNLEHILPENPKESSIWVKEFNIDDREIYTYKLGNLTLLLGKKNSSLGNKDFKYKRKKLSESGIAQNKEIATLEKWGKREIDIRTDRLIELLLKIF